jgi:sulfonate transport system permease protein
MALGMIAFGSVAGLACGNPWICGDRAAALGGRPVLGLARWQGLVKIAPPSATPDILAGLRLGLTVSLILAVVCEMIAGLDGLGQSVLLATRAYKSVDIFAGVALLGAIGVVGNGALLAIESRVLRGRSP